jgi:site-specific DNA-adenine methylase
MFSYYGTKRSLAPHYPKPKHDLIIEPFAGAAAYACLYPEREVWLCDIDPVVIATWEYLIAATSDEIMALPDLHPGDKVSDYDVPLGAQHLMGFAANPGSAQPKITATQRCKWNDQKVRIAGQVDRIKHWHVFQAPWSDLPDIEATWFVDPPYQAAGKWYRHNANKIDFYSLGVFCKTRQGQVIVCENDGAEWLPFKPFRLLQGSRQSNLEAVWMND